MSKKPISGPHVAAPSRVEQIMRQVIIALAPATALGVLLFGWPALYLLIITVISAMLFEAFCLKLKGLAAAPALRDGSAMLTGLLVAMTLPPWAPWWIGVAGSAIAIVLGKQVYGGLGQNVFNPAMLARVALLISFPIEMTTWANVAPLLTGPGPIDSLAMTFFGPDGSDAITGATTLGLVKTGFSQGQTLPAVLEDYSG
ncbi:MAG: RnfABCDGE type electron transport complex subunit D, partial [Methylomonas sp.]